MNTDLRYSRQILLKEFGQLAQDKLSSAKVLVVGAGGLGCPALQYLAAAGIGTIGIVDFDLVEVSNLQRQILFSIQDVGSLKTKIAANKIRTLNSEINIIEHNLKINNQNALELISTYDILIDGTDNFSTRYMLNDACVILEKPYVYAAVFKFEGQLALFNNSSTDGEIKTNYRDLFPSPPENTLALSCDEVGVLGVIPGIIGTMQATEAIKLITGIGRTLTNKLLCFNALDNSFIEFDITPKNNYAHQIPHNKESFLNFNYDMFCNHVHQYEISIEVLNELLTKKEIKIIDIRELNELPKITKFEFINLPLSKFDSELYTIPTDKKIVFLCQSGARSLIAVSRFKELHPSVLAYSLEGGINKWVSENESL